MWNSTPNSGTVEPQVKMLWAESGTVKIKVNPSDTRVDSLGGHWLGGGNSNIFFYFHPENWGRWTHFDEHIFQMGWNHQLAELYIVPVQWNTIDSRSFDFRWFWMGTGPCGHLIHGTRSVVPDGPVCKNTQRSKSEIPNRPNRLVVDEEHHSFHFFPSLGDIWISLDIYNKCSDIRGVRRFCPSFHAGPGFMFVLGRLVFSI